MTTTLSAVERTELKWSQRGQNVIAQYLRWISLRLPWAWRVRLDMAVLLNLLIGAMVLLIVVTLPAEYGDTSISSVVGFIYLGVTLPVIGLAFFWAYTVTKSVRARSAPRLGGEPGVLTSIAVCACFGVWILIASAAPYVAVARDKGSGGYQLNYYAEEAAAAPMESAADAETPEAREQAAVEAARLAAQRQRLAQENRRQASIVGAMFGPDVHAFWYAGRYGEAEARGRQALSDFIEATPRWRDDQDLTSLRAINAYVYAYPGLVQDFQRSDQYANALLAHYIATAGAASESYVTIRSSVLTELSDKFGLYVRSADYVDDTLEHYVTGHLIPWIQQNRQDKLDELAPLEAAMTAALNPTDPAAEVDAAAYRSALRAYRRILAGADINQAYQASLDFESYVSERLTNELSAGHYQQRVRAEPGYRKMMREVENGGDPSRAMPEHELRQDLISNGWSTGVAMVFIAALLLAMFVTSLNRVGLAATLGAAGVGALMAGIFGAFGLFNTAVVTTTSDQFVFRYYWTITALIALSVPLILAVRDALTGVRRRWSRALALGAVWGSVGWVLVLVNIWIYPLLHTPNALATTVLSVLIWMVGVAIFAKLVFALVARISAYPQPG